MEKDVYSSKEEFMRSQFPEFYKDSPKISTYQKEEIIIHDDSSTTYKEEVFIYVEEKINCSNNCLHEHCVIKDRLSIGKGKLTLVYRCLDCGECMLDCRSYLGGIAILTLAGTISKNATINYQKVLGKK